MKIIRHLNRVHASCGSVVTLGNFDGIHRGHRRILARVVKRARALGVRSVVVTFDPHTQRVVGAGRGFKCLSLPGEKVRLFRKLGVDMVVFLKFGSALRRLVAAEFFEKVIVRALRPSEIVFGYDHRFGKGRGGDYTLLNTRCRELGIRIRRVSPCRYRGVIVSSTRIREWLARGDVMRAKGFLGGPYLICGRVVRGDRIGRTLGFPTVNLKTPPEKLLMPDGVYAGYALLGNRRVRALVSIGKRPTFNGRHRLLEAHLPGFHGSLYGKEVCLEIEEFVRPQRKFRTPGALAVQIRKDIQHVIKN